jgi:1-acyl-sn-glycerol-3-phosphate acyltransferase
MASFLRILWLNTTFWLSFLAVTIVFSVVGTVCVIGFAVLVRNRRQTLWLLRRMMFYYGAAVIRCGWPLVRVEYHDHAPEDRGPFVFVVNHRSMSDPFLMSCLPFECIMVVNIWPFRIPWLGWVAKTAGYLSVREMQIEKFLAAGTQALADGVSVIAFPEGTRSGSRSLGPFHGSAIRLAQQAGAAIVPIAALGNENTPPRGSLLLRPAKITIDKLPAFAPAEHRGMSAFKLKGLVRDRLQRHLDALEATPTPEAGNSRLKWEGASM